MANQIKNVMLESIDDIKAATYLNNNVNDNELGAALRETQNIHLQDIIGSNLLYRIQELIYNAIEGNEDTIDDEKNEDYKTLLEDYIQPYLEAKIQAIICLPITYKTRNLGVTKSSDDNINYPSSDEVLLVQNRYNTSAGRYATILSKYLCANKEKFPELSQTCCSCVPFVEPKLNKNIINTGLFIGGKKNKCGC